MIKNYSNFTQSKTCQIKAFHKFFLDLTSIEPKIEAIFIMCFFALLFANNSFGQSQTFTTSGNWARPANVTHVTVQSWGAGGAGGGTDNANNSAGAGGGAGGYARRDNIPLGATVGPYPYTVGIGGTPAGGTGTNNANGLNGSNTTSTINGVTITADFGRGGTRGTGGGAGTGGAGGTTNTGDFTSTGGNGANGRSNNDSGGGGGSGGGNGNGGNAVNRTGGTAGAGGAFLPGIVGANGSNNNNDDGINGASRGAGGSGGFGDGSNTYGGNGAAGEINFTYISVSAISPNPVCTGNTITITGTNFAVGASTVTIGGVACTSVTRVSATSITAVVEAGTPTGSQVVTITNPNGTNNGISITINTSPTAPGNPTSNSPQCNPGGVTITQSGSAPAGETWYWQTTATGTSTANNASTPLVVNTSGTYYIRSRNNISTCWSNGAGSIAVTVNNSISTLATPTAPTNGATGVCYAGTGPITQLSWGAAAGATGYDVYFGTTALPAMVSSNQVGTTWLITPALIANTTYYWRIEPRNACGLTTGTPVNWTFTTGSTPCYCTPSSSSTLYYIAGVSSEGTLTNGSNTPTTYSAGGYGNYTAITMARQIPGGGINININLAGAGGQAMRTYVDWNNDGVFADPAEEVYNTGTTLLTGPTTYGFVVPSGQAPGNYRMRIRSRGAATIDPCSTLASGEAEDYTIIIVADCLQKITSITNGSACGSNTVNLVAVSAGATGFRWYSAETGGSLLADVVGSGNWTTPSIATTTTYYVTAYNGTCESLYRTPVKATILTTTNITVTPSAPILCGENIPISITAAGDTTEEDLLVQDFESGMAPFTATIPTNTNAGADSPWSIKTSPYQPSGTSVWKPAINSGSVATIGNRFALSSSDYNSSNIVSILTSPVVNPSTYTSLTLTFDHYYSYFSGDSGAIQVSVNGGAFAAVSPAPALYNSDIGTPSNFITQTVDLSAYALPANASLQFRFVYTAQFDDGWAIDNIKLSGVKPLNTTFTWSGGVDAFTDVACTIPYVAQSVTTIYVKPNSTQITSPSWAFTATATLSNGCSVVKNVTVTNNTKSWTGANSTLWSDANNWAPSGVPTAANCVVIPSVAQITGSGYNAFAKNLKVKSTGNLELQSLNNLTVSDEIVINSSGIFNVRNSANLVQVNNLVNVGNITMERTANIRELDYVFWSSPVGGAAATFPSTSISPLTPSSLIWKWLPTNGSNTNGFGNWINGNENMSIGKGYIVRGPDTYTTTITPYTGSFNGIPNNGTIPFQITRGTYNGANYGGPTSTAVTKDDDNWNLVGNPYPSSIRVLDFLTANPSIDGNVRIWTHGTAPSTGFADPFYQNYQYNYSSGDFIVHNGTGTTSGPAGFTGFIGAGQGFFVLMNHAAATPGSITFNNTMRSNTYTNSNFYRTAVDSSSTIVEDGIEKNRIWLDFIAPSGNVNRILVGYIQGATQDRDRMFDATVQENVTQNFYSRIAGENMVIQGRALPFDENDQVPLGVLVPQTGNYKIGIATVDGLFTNTSQNIYLEDLTTGITHDLRTAPYSFDATPGRFENRFVLRYTNVALSNNDFDYVNEVKVFANNNINVTSATQSIKEVIVYDVLGKTLADRKNIGKTEVVLTDLKPTTGMLIVKVILDNNAEVIKKIIY